MVAHSCALRYRYRMHELSNFYPGPRRELMPSKRRSSAAWQVWIQDSEGERLLAHVLERREAVAFSVRLFLARTHRCSVTIRRRAFKKDPPAEVLIGSDLNVPAPVRAVAFGDWRDTWCDSFTPPPEEAPETEPEPEVALPPPPCYHRPMKTILDPEKYLSDVAGVKKSDRSGRYLNVRITPALREILAREAARLYENNGIRAKLTDIVAAAIPQCFPEE